MDFDAAILLWNNNVESFQGRLFAWISRIRKFPMLVMLPWCDQHDLRVERSIDLDFHEQAVG